VQTARSAAETKIPEFKKQQPPLAVTDTQSTISKTGKPTPASASPSASKSSSPAEATPLNKPAGIPVQPNARPGPPNSVQNQREQRLASPPVEGQTVSAGSTTPSKTQTVPGIASASEQKPESNSANKTPAPTQKAVVKQSASTMESKNPRTQPSPVVADDRTASPKTANSVPLSKPAESIQQKVENKKSDIGAKSPAAANPKVAPLTSFGDRTMTRMLGLKIGRIVIDPGHGGYDLGTVGPGGLYEKDIVLSIARDLQKLLQEQMGAEVFLTRNDDAFISLEERTAIANQHHADLFISIHANSSRNRSISGVETYYLDFAKSDTEREIAARENATTASSVHELEDLIKKIAQADKSAESKELASIVQKDLFSGAHRLFPSAQNRGVRSAPFIVLIGANMPSVLTEIAFISNPRDERLLKKAANQERLVKALFSGIEDYVKTLGSNLVQNQINK
jgi:N-acetylmuramoyl-L-alanine amidase